MTKNIVKYWVTKFLHAWNIVCAQEISLGRKNFEDKDYTRDKIIDIQMYVQILGRF